MFQTPLNAEQDQAVRAEIEAGRTIQAIKLYREFTGTGLKEAKDAVEAMCDERAGNRQPGGAAPGVTTGVFSEPDARGLNEIDRTEAEQYLLAGQKIQAIKVIRSATGLGLKEAKDAADAMEANLREREPLKFRAVQQGKSGCAGVLLFGVAFLLFAAIAAGIALA